MIDEFTTLTSLAILKADIDEQERDYLDYLQSFILHVLKKYRPDPVTDDIISSLLLDEFGLRIPNRGCNLALRRIAKRGFLKKDNNTYIITPKVPKVDFTKKREAAHREIEAVYTNAISFAKTEFNIKWTEADFSKAFISFLARFGVDFLRAYVFKTALPFVHDGAPKELYIISKYIKTLRDTGDPLFESVLVLVKGQMYSNALVCPDLESIEKNFKNVTFYIDTALILNYLKLQGDESYKAVDELFSLAHKLEGSIAIFEHTYDEINSVLHGTINNLDNPHADGRILMEVRKTDITKSDLLFIKDNLQENLFKNKIHIKPTPKYVDELQISEIDLENIINDKIKYRNPDALKYDINSIRSIYTLRKGKVPRRLEDSLAVFVTNNVKLAKAAFELGKDHNSTKEVSSVVTDFSLANVAWLKAPLGAPELPTKELLASCYAAMEPSAPLLSRYVREIDDLKQKQQISPDDHALLRVSPLAAQELMNLTLGDEEALSGGSIRAILERVKSKLIEDKDSEIDAERSKKIALIKEKNTLTEEKDRANTNIYWLTGKISSYLSGAIITFTTISMIIVSLYSSYLTNKISNISFIISIIINIIFFITILWGFINWIYGISIIDLHKNIKNKIHIKLYNLLVHKIYNHNPK